MSEETKVQESVVEETVAQEAGEISQQDAMDLVSLKKRRHGQRNNRQD